MSAFDRLQRALSIHGVEADRWALAEACRGNPTLDTLARCAREYGLEAHQLRLPRRDLRYVGVGALVLSSDGGMATLVAHAPRGAVIEYADGRREHVGASSVDDATMILRLDRRLDPSARGGGTLLQHLRRLVHEDATCRRALGLVVALAVVALGLGLAGPILTHAVVGSALPERATHTLAVAALVLALLGGQLAYVGWLRRRSLLYLTTRLSERASVGLVAHALRLPFAELRRMDTASLQQAVGLATRAAEALPALLSVTLDAVLGSGFLVYAFVLDPTSAAFAAAAILALVTTAAVGARGSVALRRDLIERARREQQCLFETLTGIETVKSEAIEGHMLGRWRSRLLAEEEAALAVRIRDSRMSTLLVAVNRLVFGAVLLTMAERCLAHTATVADLIAAVQATASLMSSAQAVVQLPTMWSALRSDLERADLVMSKKPDSEGGRPSGDTERPAPALALRDVWFRYDDDSPWVLAGVDLSIEQGEHVMLSWPSGAGKSSLLRILSGLLPPTRGDALVLGSDAARARRAVTYIPQQATLFALSLMDNLRILSGGAPPERIVAAAKSTGLLDAVSGWPMGLDTVVSFGATNISSGQRQLVIFTAAVASEAPIVLLDEALAHVDLKIRARLGAASLFRGRTVISVVHDASARELGRAREVPTLAATG
jgi:ABC-type bacteriocin/lantibiotic exporter with double-glycine peptidase domain